MFFVLRDVKYMFLVSIESGVLLQADNGERVRREGGGERAVLEREVALGGGFHLGSVESTRELFSGFHRVRLRRGGQDEGGGILQAGS